MLVPDWPRQDVCCAVEMGVQAAVGHELVDEQEVVALVAPPDELHKVAMPEAADDGHLRDVLPPPLLGRLGDPLDGHMEPQILQEPTVD